MCRNGGHIDPPLYHDYEHVKNTVGRREARRIMRFRLAHLPILQAVGARHAADADCRKVDTVDVFYDEETFQEAKRLLRIYEADVAHELAHVCIRGEAMREVRAKRQASDKAAEHGKQKYFLSKEAVGCIATCAGAVQPYRFVTGILSRLLSEYPEQYVSANEEVTG